jgi:hypothetical protein
MTITFFFVDLECRSFRTIRTAHCYGQQILSVNAMEPSLASSFHLTHENVSLDDCGNMSQETESCRGQMRTERYRIDREIAGAHCYVFQDFNAKLFDGASAVDLRNTRLVSSSYSSTSGQFNSLSTSLSSAPKAYRASSVCDICTVVRGGVKNCASRISSKPTSQRRDLELQFRLICA